MLPFFAIDPTGRVLFATNEDSDTIVPFAINQTDGTLRPEGAAIPVEPGVYPVSRYASLIRAM